MARGFNTTDGVGTTDRLETTYTTHATTRTYAMWVYVRSFVVNARLFDKADGGAEVETLSLGADFFKFKRNRSIGDGGWSTPTGSSTSTWYHLAVTYDDTSTANVPGMYIDGSGVTATEYSVPNGTASTNSDKYVIGNRGDGSTADRCLDGRLAEFAIWDRILTASEITSLAGGTQPNLIATPVCYVPMLNGTADEYNTDPTVTGTADQTHPSGVVYISSVSTDDVIDTTENPWTIAGSGFGTQ